MLIGELVKKSGLTKDTIRYYEKMDILNNRVIERNPENGYKNYSEEALKVLEMIQIAKRHGCTLNEAKVLLDYHYEDKLTCFSILPLIAGKMKKLDEKIQALERQKAHLVVLQKRVDNCLEELVTSTNSNEELIEIEKF